MKHIDNYYTGQMDGLNDKQAPNDLHTYKHQFDLHLEEHQRSYGQVALRTHLLSDVDIVIEPKVEQEQLEYEWIEEPYKHRISVGEWIMWGAVTVFLYFSMS
ncbi:MAG: hypothetical protein MJK15_01760 [Colwellia sp.]|nr:hypothetical protein [Colwellia sp.]